MASTSATHCSWVNGSSSLDSPEPRASKTMTRIRSANGPKERFGSAREPRPGAPWWTIIAGASAGPNASTTSSAPLIFIGLPR